MRGQTKKIRQGGTARASTRMLSTKPFTRSSYWFVGSPAIARVPWRRISAAETSISSSCSNSFFVGGYQVGQKTGTNCTCWGLKKDSPQPWPPASNRFDRPNVDNSCGPCFARRGRPWRRLPWGGWCGLLRIPFLDSRSRASRLWCGGCRRRYRRLGI